MKLDAGLGFRQMEMRRIYVRPKVIEWLEKTLPEIDSFFGTEISPLEDLDSFLVAFCSGEPLMVERQLKPLQHISAGVWELKTRDLRLFGWFPSVDCFVCTACDSATRVKEYKLYRGYQDEAVRFRDSLDLDPPKFIQGDAPSAVVSAFSYP